MLSDRGYSLLLQRVSSYPPNLLTYMQCSAQFSSWTPQLFIRTAIDDDQVLITTEGTPSAKRRNNAYLKKVHSSGVTLSLSGEYVVKEMLDRIQSLKSRFGYAICYKTTNKSLTSLCLFSSQTSRRWAKWQLRPVPCWWLYFKFIFLNNSKCLYFNFFHSTLFCKIKM